MRDNYLNYWHLISRFQASLGDFGTMVAPLFCPPQPNGISFWLFIIGFSVVLINYLAKALIQRKAEYDQNKRFNSLSFPELLKSIEHLSAKEQSEIIKLYFKAFISPNKGYTH